MALTDKQVKYRMHQRRQAGIPAWTDAEVVRAHLKALDAAGIPPRQAARLAGVHHDTVRRIFTGPSGGPPPLRTRRDIALKLLAVKASDAGRIPAGLVDATGTRRRLQALVACGWSQVRLSLMLGYTKQRVADLMTRHHVTAATAMRVAALYGRLWDQPPPGPDRHRAAGVTRARRMAAERGWPAPAAWDDDIDDPAAVPRGWQRPERLTGAEIAEEAADLFRQGLDRNLAAERLGMSKPGLDAVLARECRRRMKARGAR